MTLTAEAMPPEQRDMLERMARGRRRILALQREVIELPLDHPLRPLAREAALGFAQHANLTGIGNSDAAWQVVERALIDEGVTL